MPNAISRWYASSKLSTSNTAWVSPGMSGMVERILKNRFRCQKEAGSTELQQRMGMVTICPYARTTT